MSPQRGSDDHVTRLEALANREQPGPDAAFANRLESDLRELMHERSAPTPRPWWQPAMALASVAMIVLVGLFILRSTESEFVVVDAATDTQFFSSGGETIAGSAGTELLDGTRIVVGPDGSAVIGGVVLDAGVEAQVVDGRVVVVEPLTPPDSPSSPTTSAGGDDRSSTTDSRPPSTRDTNPPTSTDRSSTTNPSATTPTTIDDRLSTTSTPATDARSTSTTETTNTAVTNTAATAFRIDLSVSEDGRTQWSLDWILEGSGPDIAAWDIEVISGDRRRVIATLQGPSVRSVSVERLDVEVSYRVVARGVDGGVVVTSGTVPAPPS